MRKKLFSISLILVFATLGCIGQPTTEEVILLEDLIENPVMYKNKRVGMTGYVWREGEKTFCENTFFGVSCDKKDYFHIGTNYTFDSYIIATASRSVSKLFSWATTIKHMNVVGEVKVAKNIFGENFFYFAIEEGEIIKW